MLNAVIRFSLHQRLLVVAVSLLLVGLGVWQIRILPIDVFPDLNRPRVTVITEAPGMAPEQVEALITFPLETVLNGANNVVAVRSASGVSISVIYVDFEYGTDIYDDRQIVAERLQLAADRIPPGLTPQLAPVSSIMGQIQMIGMWSKSGETGPLELRTLADWVVRQRLLTVPGVSQVFVMGGGRKQFQVLVDPDALRNYGVTMHDVKQAVARSNRNAVGGYMDDQGPNELLVRTLGRVRSVADLENLVVSYRDGKAITLAELARIVEGPQVKRGDSAAYLKTDAGEISGGPAVVLTVNKQPAADTRRVTAEIEAALRSLRPSLPDDVVIAPALYSQKAFIERAIDNVIEALRDGGILVVVILFLFLLNFRTTFITLTAIPLSIVVTALIFTAFELSINTMTLGGLAVAIGELVDDAIVDVENIFRRLRENRRAAEPQAPLRVIYDASVEIRNSIVFGTMIVVLVFLPLFALTGMEGRLFVPLGVAYIVSILSSLLVSLTLTPVLASFLLVGDRVWRTLVVVMSLAGAFGLSYYLWPALDLSYHALLGLPVAAVIAAVMLLTDRMGQSDQEGLVLTMLKCVAGWVIGLSVRFSSAALTAAVIAVAVAGIASLQLENDFLPPFNEGTVQLNLVLPPGTSLKTSDEIAQQVDLRLLGVEEVLGLVRRTGRAELDEHAEGVSKSEIIIDIDPHTDRTREEVLRDIRDATADVPGVVATAEQPLAHLISHMLSGVQAQVGIKLYGDDLAVLRRTARDIEAAIQDVPGVTDLVVERQTMIPQLRIELQRDKLELYGLQPDDVNELVETAMQGEVVSQVLTGQRTFDLLIRLDDPFREDLDALRRLPIETPDGGTVPLDAVAKVYRSSGPNTINREQVKRRIVIQCNVAGRGLVDTVADIRERLQPIEAALAPGYFIEYGGQFESQQSAARTIGVLFLMSLAGVFLVLYSMFRSANFSLQVMAAVPMAFIGAVAALVLTGQTLTVAAMVGFISLAGIASRNGILLLNHYLHLVSCEGQRWNRKLLVRAGQERLAPVLMTALTSGIGLVPLALAAGEPGKEILYPVATVMIGGLLSSTMLEFLVRPALFSVVGMRAGRQLAGRQSGVRSG